MSSVYADEVLNVPDEHGAQTRRAPGAGLRDGSRNAGRLRATLVAGDVVAATVAWLLPAIHADSPFAAVITEPFTLRAAGSAVAIAGVVAFTIALLATERLYLSRVCSMRTVEVSRIGRASVVVGIAALVVSKFAGEAQLARVPLLTGLVLFLALNLWRATYATWLSSARRSGRFTRPVLLIGADEEAFNLHDHINRHPELGYRIEGVVGSANAYKSFGFDAPWLGETPFLGDLLDKTGIRGAIVAGGALARPQLNVVVRELLRHQVHVHMSTGIAGIDHRRMVSHSLAYEPMVYVEQSALEGWQMAIKRVLDVTVAGTLLLLSAPLILIAAAAVKATDRGPIFFRQERVGRHGKVFRMVKLRSMCIDAEAKLVDLREANVRQGPLFKMDTDPRVTRIGRIMRATSIDELPQLWNVLRGDMSLVGPRPALPSEVENFDEVLMARHTVMPGITGLWQVEARDNPDFTLYQRLDLFYVENWSVVLDLAILSGTAKVVLMRAWQSLVKRDSKVAVTPKASMAFPIE